ncbi:MAG: hypothetical protein WBM40_05115 [Thiohalocapsa sp.]
MIAIRAALDSDRPQVLTRIREVFGAGPAVEAERLWQWQWHQDPRLPRPGYRAVVAEWEGNILGNLALVPAGLFVDGRPIVAHWCVSALVHWGSVRQALRAAKRAGEATGLEGRGVAEALFDAPLADGVQLGKHISSTMRAVSSRIGFVEVANSGSLHRRVSLRRRLSRGIGAAPARLVAPVANLTLPRLPPVRLAGGVDPLEGPFDARFDQLWERLRGRFPAVTLRDQSTLQWRYRQHPLFNYRVLTLTDGPALRGYLIYSQFERDRRLRGKIVDLFADPVDDEAMLALLAAALRAMKRDAVERVEAFASTAYLNVALQRAGFDERLSKAGRMQPMVIRRLALASVHVGQGDGDGG